MRRNVLSLLVCTLLALAAAPAHAQLRQGSYRLWLDADIFSVGSVRQNPRGPAPPTTDTVVALGPNQLGNSRQVLAMPSLGVGFSWVLRPKWMLGLRTGFGYDSVAVDGGVDQKALAFSFMPDLRFVPFGDKAKVFFKFSPIAQFNQLKQGSTRRHIFMGCFSVGVGTFLFASASSSIDLGAYFEGRFGKLKPYGNGSYIDVDDLRGVIRVAISLWR